MSVYPAVPLLLSKQVELAQFSLPKELDQESISPRVLQNAWVTKRQALLPELHLSLPRELGQVGVSSGSSTLSAEYCTQSFTFPFQGVDQMGVSPSVAPLLHATGGCSIQGFTSPSQGVDQMGISPSSSTPPSHRGGCST
jgi:hypothetical protein